MTAANYPLSADQRRPGWQSVALNVELTLQALGFPALTDDDRARLTTLLDGFVFAADAPEMAEHRDRIRWVCAATTAEAMEAVG